MAPYTYSVNIMKDIVHFLFEVGMLKKTPRTGYQFLGSGEESVADHSFRSAIIGYILSLREKETDAYKTVLMCLFHDLHEARINDMHKVAAGYLNVKEAEKAAFADQTEDLDEDIRSELKGSRDEYDAQRTPESLIARDADILECLIQAKEYADIGYRNAEKFFKSAPEHLRTESARRLWEKARSWDSSSWWGELGRFER